MLLGASRRSSLEIQLIEQDRTEVAPELMDERHHQVVGQLHWHSTGNSVERLKERIGGDCSPWPPHFTKQKGEPKRVQPSKAKRPGTAAGYSFGGACGGRH